MSADGRTIAFYGGTSELPHLLSCNATMLSCTAQTTSGVIQAGGTAALALSADGTRIAVAPTSASGGPIQTATRVLNNYAFRQGNGGATSTWGGLATSADGSILFFAENSAGQGFIQQAFG